MREPRLALGLVGLWLLALLSLNCAAPAVVESTPTPAVIFTMDIPTLTAGPWLTVVRGMATVQALENRGQLDAALGQARALQAVSDVPPADATAVGSFLTRAPQRATAAAEERGRPTWTPRPAAERDPFSPGATRTSE